ncbi:UNKNOWN [Stylonychia lemnae]|uniref:Uncharacterized protein n=1 Tax=Stylonychia lemnae TaxID=5949 RepID=A0A078AP97_STYLE|nr:UNKNOWN [Stylonychia lemnae]|eukprot:CDW84195.1 UNKNOWN [Stylonychia lemnae]
MEYSQMYIDSIVSAEFQNDIINERDDGVSIQDKFQKYNLVSKGSILMHNKGNNLQRNHLQINRIQQQQQSLRQMSQQNFPYTHCEMDQVFSFQNGQSQISIKESQHIQFTFNKMPSSVIGPGGTQYYDCQDEILHNMNNSQTLLHGNNSDQLIIRNRGNNSSFKQRRREIANAEQQQRCKSLESQNKICEIFTPIKNNFQSTNTKNYELKQNCLKKANMNELREEEKESDSYRSPDSQTLQKHQGTSKYRNHQNRIIMSKKDDSNQFILEALSQLDKKEKIDRGNSLQKTSTKESSWLNQIYSDTKDKLLTLSKLQSLIRTSLNN